MTARGRRLSAAAVGALASSAAACLPLPIPHRAQVTPPVVGTLHRADGTPVRGTPVAVTTSAGDARCAGPGARGVTDSSGRSRLPSARVRRRVFWLTMFENFGLTHYWFCAGTGAPTEPTGRGGGAPRWAAISGRVRGDTLACLEWQWRAAPRVTCNGWHNQARILTAGRWSDGAVTGAYRLLLPDEDGSSYQARAVVQWITAAPRGASLAAVAVRAQAELPTGKAVIPRRATLTARGDRWRVRVQSVQPTKWGRDRWLTFELGPPGQVRQVSEP